MKIFPLVAFCTLNGYVLAYTEAFPTLWIAFFANAMIIAFYIYIEIFNRKLFEA